MSLGDAVQVMILASGWLCAAWALGERVEGAMLPSRPKYARRTSPPAPLTPRSGLWKKGGR